MANVTEVLSRLMRDWAVPRATGQTGQLHFPLACKVVSHEVDIPAGLDLPPDLAELWRYAGAMRLFEDTEFGQWGLAILNPQNAVETTESRLVVGRPNDFVAGDLVVGEFLGDLDLLVVRTDRGMPDFGHVLVALPMEKRSEWYAVSRTLGEFLEQFAVTEGEKYWVISRPKEPRQS